MKINHVKISNILGIDELEFEAGKFNEISGQNGQGKTSVIEAVKAALQGGHDATLLRSGAEKGEIVLVLDDGTKINKRVTPNSSPITVEQNGERAKKPTEVLKTLTDMLSVNPIDFLLASDKDRVRVLLETMPIKIDPARLSEISGVKVSSQWGDTNGLAVIDMVRRQVYDDRTGTNRAVKEKDATINQLRLAMPDAPAGVTGTEDELLEKLEACRVAKDAELERIQNKLTGIQVESRSKVDAIKADAQARIDAIRAEMQEAVAAEEARLKDIEGKASMQRERTINAHNETITPIQQALAAIKANRSAAAKREQALETIKVMEGELESLQKDAESQTKALEAIDAYKLELLASLPIPGLEVKDGQLFRDGVTFSRLNTAQQVEIAVELAKLRAGDLKICCVDKLECLDSETFEAFRASAVKSDLQLFVTRVKDGEFEVKTDTQ